MNRMIEFTSAVMIGAISLAPATVAAVPVFGMDRVIFALMGVATAIVLIPSDKRNMWTAVATGIAGMTISLTLSNIVTAISMLAAVAWLPDSWQQDLERMRTDIGQATAFILALGGLFIAGKLYTTVDQASNNPGNWLGKLAANLFKRRDDDDAQPPSGRM